MSNFWTRSQDSTQFCISQVVKWDLQIYGESQRRRLWRLAGKLCFHCVALSLTKVIYIFYKRFSVLNMVLGQTVKRQTINEEPHIHIPLNLDRLRCTVAILSNLMRCDEKNYIYPLLRFPFQYHHSTAYTSSRWTASQILCKPFELHNTWTSRRFLPFPFLVVMLVR